MFSGNWQPGVPKYNWVNWQWAGFTNHNKHRHSGPKAHFQRRITDCSIVFQINKYVNLTCFLNVCKHIMVFLCFSRVKILHTAPLRVRQQDLIFVLMLHVFAHRGQTQCCTKINISKTKGCYLISWFSFIPIMMTSHKELSSPKNIHSPTNNCERPSEILIIWQTNIVRKKYHLQKIIILRCVTSLTKSVGIQK